MRRFLKLLIILVAVFMIAGVAFAAQEVEDGCKESDTGDNPIDARNDVNILSATYDPDSGSIEVCAVLCDDECMPGTQYRFHFDYDMANGMASYLSPDDRDEGSCSISVIENPTGTTSDNTVRFVCGNDGVYPKKVTGPAEVYTSVNESGEFCITVPLSELVREDGSMIEQGEVIDIWMDVQNKGKQDRAPDTDDSDGCSKPTGPGEVLLFTLDGTPPEIACPPDVMIGCNDATDPSNTGEATATDDCDPSPTISFTDSISNPSCSAEATITRVWTATDGSGNASSCEQIIQLVDDEPPTITCPDDIEVESSGEGVVVEYSTPQASDNCDPNIIVACDPASGNEFSIGSTDVVCTATDCSGNTASCQFSVVVTITDPCQECAYQFTLDEMQCENDYWSCVESCPPDPDCTYECEELYAECHGMAVNIFHLCLSANGCPIW